MIKFIKRLIARIRIPKGLYCTYKCPYYDIVKDPSVNTVENGRIVQWNWCSYLKKHIDDMPYRDCGINQSSKNEGGTLQ